MEPVAFYKLSFADQQKTILTYLADDKNEAELDELIYFFDAVWICVKSRACDANTAEETFDVYVSDIYERFETFIEKERESDRDGTYGIGLEKLYRLPREGLLTRVSPL